MLGAATEADDPAALPGSSVRLGLGVLDRGQRPDPAKAAFPGVRVADRRRGEKNTDWTRPEPPTLAHGGLRKYEAGSRCSDGLSNQFLTDFSPRRVLAARMSLSMSFEFPSKSHPAPPNNQNL